MAPSKLSKIERRIKKKAPKTKDTTRKRRKKANFPWLKHSYARKAKAYMAYLIDTTTPKIPSRKRKKYFKKTIYPAVKARFPKLYGKIKEYYHNHGHSLTKVHFQDLLFARLINMFEDGFAVKSSEHPLNSTNKKLQIAYSKFS